MLSLKRPVTNNTAPLKIHETVINANINHINISIKYLQTKSRIHRAVE